VKQDKATASNKCEWGSYSLGCLSFAVVVGSDELPERAEEAVSGAYRFDGIGTTSLVQ